MGTYTIDEVLDMVTQCVMGDNVRDLRILGPPTVDITHFFDAARVSNLD